VLHAWPPQPLHGPHKEPVPEYNSDSDTAAGHASVSNPLSGFYSDSAYEFDFGSDPEDPESEDNTTEQPLSGPASGLVITSIPAGRIVCWPNRKPADLITRESRDVTNLDSLPFQEGTPLTRAEEYTSTVKDRYGEPERGGELMGADKNSSRRRWKLQQDEHGLQHTSPTHYPSWPSPRSHWSATGPRNQHTIF
jgi:hypothetical protein